jgi:radical SAM superfamily enzyme YgiQ (UPF0313 family)
MDILALYPDDPDLRFFEKMPSLGMLSVAGMLCRAGHQVTFIDQQVDSRDPADVAKALKPALTLIGGTSHSRFASFEMARQIKEVVPETTIIYGGPHGAFTAADTLSHQPAIDLIVHGEGEYTCLELARWKAESGGDPSRLEKLAGISYRNNGDILRSPDRPAITDLDALGAPARDLVPISDYQMNMDYLDIPGTSLITARGCPIACTFCSASAMFGKSYRMRSTAAVVDEVEDLINHHGVKGIKIFDSTFTLVRRHAEDFCNELLRRKIDVPWECEIRVDTVDKALLSLMRESGCYYVDVGVESGSQRVLDECIGKRIKLEQAQQALEWAKEIGMLTKVFFTAGHPGETYAEAMETVRFVRKNAPLVRIAGFHTGIKVYPGTYVDEYARENNLLPDGFNWSKPYLNEDQRKLFRAPDNVPILIQPSLTLKQLRRIRIAFILTRVSSPRFIKEKIASILSGGNLLRYFRIITKGVLGKN